MEIGGGFRVPEVMEQSGAKLVEVGTTNRTRRADFASAVENPANDTALVLKVHQSNYRIVGFTEHVTVAEMATLSVPVVADIGSGLVDAACPWLDDGPPAWLAGEPAARQTLADGAALVTFSGDKLFGGPQAGIIAGRTDLVSQCARHPLARALRPGSLVLTALQQVALAYLRRDGQAIDFWRMASLVTADLESRARRVVADSGVGEVVQMASVPGGGTLPGTEIDSCGVVVDGDRTAPLRSGSPPIIARVSDDQTWLDLRTVAPDDDPPFDRRPESSWVSITISTAGHVDHGKSTLVEALTGVDPDRFAEEKARGLTIDLGFRRRAIALGTVGVHHRCTRP